MIWLIALVVGILAGTHTATWGMYKDAPHEGFRHYPRSIFVSAFSDPTTRARADQAKPIAWLAKPVAVQKLVTTVNAALREKPGGEAR